MKEAPPTQAQREAVRDRPARMAVMRQQWSGLGFFHWRVDAAEIAARLPDRLFVDTFDGEAWLGVVPFYMRGVRPAGLPPVPWLSWFLELNVRTYVHDGRGRAGVWFFSLDCNQPVAVELARRFFHLPYEHAAMTAARDGDGMIDYRCRRKGEREAALCRYPDAGGMKTAAAEPGTLEWFLVERYLLFSADRRGRIFTGRVHHDPYRVAAVDAAECPGTALPVAWDGFERPDRSPDSVLVAEPVNVRTFGLERG